MFCIFVPLSSYENNNKTPFHSYCRTTFSSGLDSLCVWNGVFFMVYLIFDKISRLTKIGFTKNIKKRFASLKVGNPFIIVVWYSFNNTEKNLHNIYKNKRIKGEWFALDITDYKEIIGFSNGLPKTLYYRNTLDKAIEIISNRTNMLPYKEEIVCKWWNEPLQIGVTKSRQVYLVQNNEPILLSKEYHAGSISYRIPKTSIRISQKKIRTDLKSTIKIIQEYLPF